VIPVTVTVGIEAAGRTHVGLVKKRNEDAFYVGRHLVAVADGLGGHVAGDIASSTAVEALREYDRLTAPGRLATSLSDAVDAANRALRQRITAEPALRGMGTTLVAMLWSGSTVAVASVGDSRIYRLRGGALEQITDDHVYGRLVSGARRVPNLPERISRFLNGRPDGVSPDLTVRELSPGDRYLLCTDGLSSFVEHRRIRETLLDVDDLAAAAERLVALANDADGPDNITAVILEVR
jgi:serine/threonine protein phosphatase PrpC